MAEIEVHPPYWEQQPIDQEHLAKEAEQKREDKLLLDPRNPVETNQILLQPMLHTGLVSKAITAILGGGVLMLGITWLFQMIYGLGITGLNRPVMWALYIVNFVYFIGIGHAGTFISAALRVLGIEWRRPISRAAEIVTVFALMTAAMFPIIHLGRSWKAYWLLPYPNGRQLWPSFHSPLLWDLTAITTYLTCSMLFAYIALLPDMANARDHTKGWRHRFFEMLAMGWRGTQHEFMNVETALNVFSYAIIPVMFSVHTIVSWDFAMALQPGWHSTVFGPYFVVGALFSGAGAVIIALILLRQTMGLGYFLRAEHFNGMGKFLLILSLTWAYFFFNDYLVPWYGQEPTEKVLHQMFLTWGPGGAAPFWVILLGCNIVIPWITLWSKKVRTSLPALFFVSLIVQVGMYTERVLIIPISLSKNELPFAWGIYHLQIPETLITIGAFSFLGFAYILFTRFFPIIPAWEVYEGQILHKLRRIGHTLVDSKAEVE